MSTPTCSQRVAPFLVTPNSIVATSSATPRQYSGTRQPRQALRRDLRDDEQHAEREQHVARVVDEAGAAVEAGRVHRDQPAGGEQHDGQR